jgi:hypothetical protein
MIKYLSLISFFAISCSSMPETKPALSEIKRINSPDNKVDALLVTADGGATTATANHIFIVPKGGVAGNIEYAIFTADHSQNLDIQWKADQTLQISYERARIFKFTNFWNSDSVDNWNYIVEIQLDRSSTDSQLFDDYKHSKN